jgi:hypothetical protein
LGWFVSLFKTLALPLETLVITWFFRRDFTRTRDRVGRFKSREPILEQCRVPVKVDVLSPREAVEQAWGLVEKSLDQGRLRGPETLLLDLLRKLRDRSRLDPQSPSSDDAQRFVNLASKFAARITERG